MSFPTCGAHHWMDASQLTRYYLLVALQSISLPNSPSAAKSAGTIAPTPTLSLIREREREELSDQRVNRHCGEEQRQIIVREPEHRARGAYCLLSPDPYRQRQQPRAKRKRAGKVDHAKRVDKVERQ